MRGRKATKLLISVANKKREIDNARKKVREGPWPECVGLAAEDCEEFIYSNAPGCIVQVVYPTDFVFPDYSHERVILYVSKEGIVVGTPSRG